LNQVVFVLKAFKSITLFYARKSASDFRKMAFIHFVF